ncbi:MAG: DUF3237 domain-containing protein [Rhodococcus sp. (in: high G+C Gram-positive bacteria)]
MAPRPLRSATVDSVSEPSAANELSSDPTVPTLEPLFRIVIAMAETVHLGNTPVGAQSLAPVAGGVLSGPGVDATIRAVGTDLTLVRSDGSATYELDLLADVEASADSDDMHDAMRLALRGIRFGSAEVTAALDDGEQVDSALYYFRGTLTVSTSIRALTYLNRAVLVTSGSRHGSQLIVDAFLVT